MQFAYSIFTRIDPLTKYFCETQPSVKKNFPIAILADHRYVTHGIRSSSFKSTSAADISTIRHFF